MTDTRLDRILCYGTNAERLAFTPDPPAGVLVVFYEEDTGDAFLWDTDAGPAAWVAWPGGSATLADGDYGDITVGSSGTTLTIDSGVVSLAKMANLATDRLIGRDTAGAGVPEALTVSGGVEFSGSGGIQRSALTGDVTASAGSNSTTIANDAVTDGKLRDSAALSVIGRSANSTGDPADIAAGSDGQVLRRSGTSLGFGAVDLASANAVTGALPPANRAFRGALVKKSADQTGANYSGAGTAVAWNAETYDTDSIHDTVTNNTRLTVPSGVTYARLSGQLHLFNVAAGSDTYISIRKNGSATWDGFPINVVDQQSVVETGGTISSPVVSVSSGDYFEVFLSCADTSIDVLANGSWFAMEIVQ